MSRTSTEVKRRYNEKTYSRIVADLPKELVEQFKAKTQERGESVASVVKRAAEDYIKEEQ